MLEGTAIVVSPLLALMDDQIQSLTKRGINATTLNSTLGIKAKRKVFEELKTGNVKLLYIAPETILNKEISSFIQDFVNISFIAIDEVHCLSQWGTGFRPKYAQLYELRKLFPNKCIAGFTATADLVTRNDIINVLQFKNYTEYTHDLDRSSIKYIVYEKRDENLQTLNIIKKYPEDTCGIIYVGTRDKASALQSYLNNRNINCEFFHAGLKVAEKKQIQEDYINGNLNLIICTVAFGMGIDRSNVRYVINVDLPNSLEEFSQMSGRAARDGLESESYLLYGQQDIAKATWLIRQSVKNPDRLKINLDKLKLVVGYAQTNMCRRKKLLEYFGQKIDNCGYCDNCHKNGVYRK